MQSAVLLLKLHKLPQSTIHLVLDINHKAIKDMANKLCRLRKDFVEKAEKTIVFGNKRTWVDVEADEATFDKRDISKNTILWEQWAGAIRKIEWKSIAHERLRDRKVVLHTDFAKNYKQKVDGVIHDRVIHCKKRITINGKYQWTSPKYVTMVTHKVPGSNKKLKVKSCTQIIDRAWRFLKDSVAINKNVKAGSSLLRAKLRSAQYDYWFQKFRSLAGERISLYRGPQNKYA
ncbi:unnamed protein product [Symbiodinium sp. CCMP2456]|nr:unnamed protein product [Symbiodinium sp. CCMP2456]